MTVKGGAFAWVVEFKSVGTSYFYGFLEVIHGRGLKLGLIFCRVVNMGCPECFLPFAAGGAASAVERSALVAGVGMAIVDAQFGATCDDVGFRDVCVGSFNTDVYVCPGAHGFVHGVDEIGPAVGVDGVVAAVVGDKDAVESAVFGNAARDGKHDAVAEGHNGGVHIVLVIVVFWNGFGS